jgi:hypothetical protein
MSNFLTIIGKYKVYLAALFIVIIASLAARHVLADEAPPAEVSASEYWLQQNVPTIKKLQAQLSALQEEKDKRVSVIETFGFSVNWDTLKVFKQASPLPTE